MFMITKVQVYMMQKATSNHETYGVLYNWPAVMSSNVCPSGWHIPTVEDWTELTDELEVDINAWEVGDACQIMDGIHLELGDAGNGSIQLVLALTRGDRDSDSSFNIGSYGTWWVFIMPLNENSSTRYYFELRYFDNNYLHTFPMLGLEDQPDVSKIKF